MYIYNLKLKAKQKEPNDGEHNEKEEEIEAIVVKDNKTEHVEISPENYESACGIAVIMDPSVKHRE